MAIGGQRRTSGAWLAVALLCAGLCGCSLFSGGGKSIQSRVIEFEVAPHANQDSPIAVDIVYVFNPQLVTQLTGMTAHDWFLHRDQIRQAFPTDFDLTSFEVVPGQKGPVEQVSPRASQAIAAFVFANYASEGTHRARVDGLQRFFLELGDKDFTILPPGAPHGGAG